MDGGGPSDVGDDLHCVVVAGVGGDADGKDLSELPCLVYCMVSSSGVVWPAAGVDAYWYRTVCRLSVVF